MRRLEGSIGKDEAREMYDKLQWFSFESSIQHNSEAIELFDQIFGEWWYDSVPEMPNSDYEYLCRIIKLVQEVLREELKNA